MKIVVTSIFVEDQDKALKFYTEKLGFVKKQDFPVGEFKWLTVVSPEDRNGTELLLEPMTILLLKSIKRDSLHRAYPRQVLVLLTLKTSINDSRRLVSHSP
jgi:catechol 2,3-dioxygenase-like lactoylglutathione lyase family enzyme